MKRITKRNIKVFPNQRYTQFRIQLSGSPKPQTHRKQARSQDLQVIKKKRKSENLIRKGEKEKQWLGVAIKVFYQQKQMYETRSHQCPDRIVSVFQPHVRPIVHGKSKAKVEFGPKIGASVVGDYTFVDHFSWDAYNESEGRQVACGTVQRTVGLPACGLLPRQDLPE